MNTEIFDLRDNKLTGELPATLEVLTKLEYFNVQGNDLQGWVPGGMCQWEPEEVLADCQVRCACCTDNCNRGF